MTFENPIGHRLTRTNYIPQGAGLIKCTNLDTTQTRRERRSPLVFQTTTMTSAETPTLPTRFGWVGLGAMGYPMVGRLRRKLPSTSTLWIYDIDIASTARFLEEETQFDSNNDVQGAQVRIGNSSRMIAEESVRPVILPDILLTLNPLTDRISLSQSYPRVCQSVVMQSIGLTSDLVRRTRASRVLERAERSVSNG
jgi:3-hydroxyisobutyrate dehydrogenase